MLTISLSSTCDKLEMSVVRGVGGVCDMCMCLPRGVMVDERIGFGFYQSCGKRGSVGRVSVFWFAVVWLMLVGSG